MQIGIRLSFVVAVAAGTLSCQQAHRESETTPTPASSIDTTIHAARTAPNPEPSDNSADSPAAKLSVAGVGACQASTDLTAMASRLAELADANGDGKVSREEAQSAMNFIVGGAFFRADANGDGKITPEEGHKARAEITSRYPALGTLMTQTRNATGESPFRALARVVDVEYGKTLTLDEARQAVRGAADDLFKVADRNHDAIITREEVIDMAWERARTLGADAFATADSNKDGFINTNEFQGLINRSSKPLFDAADTDKDGKLSKREAAATVNTVIERFGLAEPEPETSVSNQQASAQ